MTKTLVGTSKIPAVSSDYANGMSRLIENEKDRLHRDLAVKLLEDIKDSPHVVMFRERVYVDDVEFCNVLEVRATLEAVSTMNVIVPGAVFVTAPVEIEPRYPCHYCGGFTKNNEVGNCKACGGERRRH